MDKHHGLIRLSSKRPEEDALEKDAEDADGQDGDDERRVEVEAEADG